MEDVMQEPGAAVAALRDHQGRVDKARTRLASLEAAVAQHEGLVTQHRRDMPDLAGLERRREDLLAAIAAGDVATDQVAELDEQVAAARRLCGELKPKIAHYESTIAGLSRRVAEARTEVAALLAEKPALVRKFLYEEAEKECFEYVKAADVLIASFERLEALLYLLREYGGDGARINLSRGRNVFVGRYRLQACDGRQHLHDDGALFDGGHRTQGPTIARAGQERASLESVLGFGLSD